MISTSSTPHGIFSYFSKDDIGVIVGRGDFWEPHVRPVMDSMDTKGVFVDAGANIGFYSVYMAKRGIRVHAFEASPELFVLLQRNVEQNGLGGLVTCHPEPLYSADGVRLGINKEWTPATLENGKVDYDEVTNSGGLSLLPSDEPGPYSFLSRTLDSFELDYVDLIKIDVQGCDFRVILGAEKTIDRCRPGVIWETEAVIARLHGDSLESAVRFFDAKEYDVVHLRSIGDLHDSLASPRWR